MTRILVTGSRDWIDAETVEGALHGWLSGDDDVLIVGDCPTGADAFALAWWQNNTDHLFQLHRADWRCHGRAAGPIRNQQMVDAKPDVCMAFIRNQSKGATDCKKRAEAAGIPVLLWEEP